MNKKVVVILVEAIIVLLFLLAVNFFYGLKMADVTAAGYQNQARRMSGLLSNSVEEVRRARQENISLSSRIDLLNRQIRELGDKNGALKEEAAGLKVDLDKLTVNGATITPIKEKLKGIAAQLDSINLSSARKEELDGLLRSIYDQVNSLDIAVARLAKDEPLYREVALAREETLKEKVEEAQKILMQNYQLNEKLAAGQVEVEKLKNDLAQAQAQREAGAQAARDKEKQIEDYRAQIDKLTREHGSESRQLAEEKQEVEKISGMLGALQKEQAGVLGAKKAIERKMAAAGGRESRKAEAARLGTEYEMAAAQYNSLQVKIKENEAVLSRRAERILSLEESLAQKSDSLARVKEAMKKRLQELVGLREAMVKVKLDNAHLREDLDRKEKAFNVLKEDLRNINKINARFGSSLDKADKIFAAPAAAGEKAAPGGVNVEIDSVSQVKGKK